MTSTISHTQTTPTPFAQRRPPPVEQDRTGSATPTGSTPGRTEAATPAGDAIDGTASAEPGTARLDPARTRERIDGLIDREIGDGRLTRDQAGTLKGLFGQPGEASRPAGSGSPSTGAVAAESADSDAASDILAGFIQQLQTNQAAGGGYTAGGAGTGSRAALLFDFDT